MNGTKVAIYGMGMIGRKFAQMLVPFDWAECKAFFVREARTIVLTRDGRV